MPKLSEDSLKKSFVCQYCGKPFRTRQGLSGHIQFKHSIGQASSITDMRSIISQAKYLESAGEAVGLSTAKSKHQARILTRWLEVEAVLDFLHIKVNNQDLKNYMLVSLAYMHENEELEGQLISEFKNLLEKYM